METQEDNNIEQQILSDKNFDARSSRCSGLLERKANKQGTNEIVHASLVRKSDGPFYCPVCLSEAIVRKCSDKADHFAHFAKQSPAIDKKHRDLHDVCRGRIS